MPHYRRAWIPGGSYFFTLALADRSQRLLVEHIAKLRAALATTINSRPFRMDALVVLPEHLHMVCTLPAGDAQYSQRIGQMKSAFSRALPYIEVPTSSRLRRRERTIWQRRYWEHAIRDEADLRAHIDYVHFNPVKHGHVEKVSQWPWSSFHRYVARGLLAADWGDAPPRIGGGEP